MSEIALETWGEHEALLLKPPLRPKVRTAPGFPRKYFWARAWWGCWGRPG
ncbi:hypothetical protein [Thermus scotoductus]